MSSNANIENAPQLDRHAQLQLLDIARASIRSGLIHGQPATINASEYPVEIQTDGASFVTLRIQGELRGCIGTLEAHHPLAQDVAFNAYYAAFRDPRFAPLNADEYPRLEIHISVLTPATEMHFISEGDLLSQLRPGVDGLILYENGLRGTFLPAVWESLNAPADFLQQLKIKAGLPPEYWSPTIRIQRYTTFSFM